MTFTGFQGLSDKEKADSLWGKGKPVATYNAGDAKFILYQLNDFYIEVEYKTDFPQIVRLKAFEITGLPLIYLDKINIPGQSG
jgi:hypothetical protein